MLVSSLIYNNFTVHTQAITYSVETEKETEFQNEMLIKTDTIVMSQFIMKIWSVCFQMAKNRRTKGAVCRQNINK